MFLWGVTNITAPNSVILNQGDSKFVKTVHAVNSACYILGIGGLSDCATGDLIAKLKVAAQLQPNQALADIYIKKTTKLYMCGVVVRRELIATASVVEFCDNSTNTLKNDPYPSVPVIADAPLGGTEPMSSGSDSLSTAVLPDETTALNPDNLLVKSDAKHYTRESAYEKLLEINLSLSSGSVGNIETVTNEVNDIEDWYNGIDVISIKIERELKRVKSLLKIE